MYIYVDCTLTKNSHSLVFFSSLIVTVVYIYKCVYVCMTGSNPIEKTPGTSIVQYNSNTGKFSHDTTITGDVIVHNLTSDSLFQGIEHHHQNPSTHTILFPFQ